MKVHVHETPSDIGALLAARIVAGIRAANGAGRAYVLGCPGGRSPMPVYEALAMQLAGTPLDCSRLVIAMMDEYLLAGPDGALTPPPASAHYSCRGFGEREILGRINSRSAEALPHPPREFLDARSVRARRTMTGVSQPPAASICSFSPPAPATAILPSTRPARRATAAAASSSLPSRRDATISPPFPTSDPWTRCPRMASRSELPRSPNCRRRP